MVKKKGGNKKQTLHLSEFLGDATPIVPAPAPVWNEDANTDLSLPPPDIAPNVPSFDVSCLPTAPRAQREGSFDPSKIPRQPPYTAYVGNLPFDTENEDVIKMFKKDTVKDVRLLTDKETNRFKGFGYVEFHTPEGLLEALKLNEKMVRGRAIKVDVATKAGENNKEGSNADRWDRGKSNERIREPYEDKTSDDWRREAKAVDTTEAPNYNYNRRGGDRERGERRRYNNASPDAFSRSDFGTKINEPPKEMEPRERRGGDSLDWKAAREETGRNAWTERPKLNIKPRAGDRPNPFGNAKPVNTNTNEDKAPAKQKANPFGKAKPADTANWRSSRVQGTGPIRTPAPQISSIVDKSPEDITDSNKFRILKDDEE